VVCVFNIVVLVPGYGRSQAKGLVSGLMRLKTKEETDYETVY
jgi:hypothetical protein